MKQPNKARKNHTTNNVDLKNDHFAKNIKEMNLDDSSIKYFGYKKIMVFCYHTINRKIDMLKSVSNTPVSLLSYTFSIYFH